MVHIWALEVMGCSSGFMNDYPLGINLRLIFDLL